MANELSTTINEITQYIVIRIGEEQYGIDIKYIDNIVRMQQITRVPQVPAHFKGVINLRGEVIPVMSIRIKMGLSPDVETKDTRIIIIKVDKYEPIGMMVDMVKEVVNLSSAEVERVGFERGDDKAAFAMGIGKHETGLVTLLDIDAVLQGL
ncbi:MAG: chemotaxis protein CheW [Lachnospiraceae bacterium]|nr:chemotaxis protein CheW [Lachnospiraceae bacterium]